MAVGALSENLLFDPLSFFRKSVSIPWEKLYPPAVDSQVSTPFSFPRRHNEYDLPFYTHRERSLKEEIGPWPAWSQYPWIVTWRVFLIRKAIPTPINPVGIAQWRGSFDRCLRRHRDSRKIPRVIEAHAEIRILSYSIKADFLKRMETDRSSFRFCSSINDSSHRFGSHDSNIISIRPQKKPSSLWDTPVEESKSDRHW